MLLLSIPLVFFPFSFDSIWDSYTLKFQSEFINVCTDISAINFISEFISDKLY